MSFHSFLPKAPWTFYSKKLLLKVENPRSLGSFSQKEALERDLYLAVGKERADEESVTLYWLLDGEDGVIVNAKFQASGSLPLIGGAEVACELLVGKNYDQARRLTVEDLDKYVKSSKEAIGFPPKTFSSLHLILKAIKNAAQQCEELPLPEHYESPMISSPPAGEGHPDWNALSHSEKLRFIEEVLTRDIRPYIELDAGGIEVIKLLNDREVFISYQGACTTCPSSIGSTLSYIQQTLRNKVSHSLIVIPEISNF